MPYDHHPCTWGQSWSFPLLSLILLALPCATAGARSLSSTPLSPSARPALALPFALHPTAASLPAAARAARNPWSRGRAEEAPWYRRWSLTAGYSVTIQLEMETAGAFRVRGAAETPLSNDALLSLLARAGVVSGNWTRREDGAGGALFPVGEYSAVLRKVRSLMGIKVEGAPAQTLAALRQGVAPLPEGERARVLARLPGRMRDALCPFQIAGVEYTLRHRCRVLLADDMGLGKTVLALAVAAALDAFPLLTVYRKTVQALAVAAALDAFPLLIVCPASVRLVWVDEFEKWLPGLRPGDLHPVFGSSDKPPAETPKVVITSYQMLHRLRSDLTRRAWKLLIVDESHALRTSASGPVAAHAKTTLALVRRVQRVMLLSGTPSPRHPLDLFDQVNALRAGLLGSSKFDFVHKYCSVRRDPFFSVGKCRREHELNLLLRHSVMVRRLKKDVFKELPPKRRALVHILIRPAQMRLLFDAPASGSGSKHGPSPASGLEGPASGPGSTDGPASGMRFPSNVSPPTPPHANAASWDPYG
ncbi:P-loop containing nucleoside triphosphate hydrolase protein, partial [Baffinella frigidus]